MSAAVGFAVFATGLIAATVFYLFFYPDWRRKRTLQAPFPAPWRDILESRVPIYRKLNEPLKQSLHQRVQLFIEEKTFYGCDGFEVDDRVRLTIAGHACLLILARPYSDYDEVRSILVYPDAYHVREVEDDGYVVSESDQVRAGEASTFGQVVLAWTECDEAARNPDASTNVILHEFAHQLDFLDGSTDGAPPLSPDQARQWQAAMTEAYEDLQETLDHHRTPWLDPYGATEPAEFFAVLTETFFQQPNHLRHIQPAVFEALRGFYGIDPEHFDRPG